ncbi:hypothetical protein SY88_15655 [Clostridiales bacterium PH28_bin88]|nr:hypothetical protein SY88_15655 [Clostridiales bacterium PH28_bin88]
MRKVIVTVATTGGIHGKEANPALPETPEEMARAAYDCYNEGTAVVHLHVRGVDARPPAIQSLPRTRRRKCWEWDD